MTEMDGTSGSSLEGLTVIVTRTREQSAALVEPLERQGADVIAFPVIAVVDPVDWTPADRAIDELSSYDWVVFSSTNAVERFMDRLRTRGYDTEALDCVKVAVVGEATSRALSRMGCTPELMPDDYRAEGLVEAFRDRGVRQGLRVLVPRALKAREIFPESLRGLGAQVDVVPVYRTVRALPDPAAIARLRQGHSDIVTFTSPSTVRNFVGVLQDAGLDVSATMGALRTASIGPVTTEALETLGFRVDVEAPVSTIPVLVESIVARLGH